MKTGNLKIKYDWSRATSARARCRELGAHVLPEDGRDGEERPGAYTCARCRVVKRVKESLS